MKKIILSLVLFTLLFFEKSLSKETEVYCLNTYSNTAFSIFLDEKIIKEKKLADRCKANYENDNFIEISLKTYELIRAEEILWAEKGSRLKETSFFGKKIYFKDDPVFKREEVAALESLVVKNMNEIRNFSKSREQTLKEELFNEQKKSKTTADNNLKKNETKFSKKCEGNIFTTGYKKGTEEYNDCLKREEKLAALEEQKQQIKNEDKNKKSLIEQEKKQKVIDDKKNAEALKTKDINDKLAKMTPDDRRAYTCSEKFGFRKGSNNFKDCVFKIYSAEVELEKLELQKQLAKANADLAKANADRQDRLALAQTETARMQAYAAQQQAIAANTADSLALMESGLRMLSPQRPAARAPMNCQYHARMLSCF